jgi:hypothetical protein
VEEDKIAL